MERIKRLTLMTATMVTVLKLVQSQRARVVDGILRRESVKGMGLFIERMRWRENLVVKVQRFVRARQRRQHEARSNVLKAAGLIRFTVPEAAQRGAWQAPAPWVRVKMERVPKPEPPSESGEGTVIAAAEHAAAVAAHEEAMSEAADVLSRWLVHDCRLGKPS
eukprot:7364061-Prymnesium_polylepis.1